ncbi:UDP:flavonoid glycosyltransferase YjiC (YdhE family) [Mycobacterium frederiksbergense]|uniref:UDP:flavonoid glycosyltransferase YjiC (YdhE family) n=1 Tax=Mycolicibacterium frederiksbergense TaxID=117567 RepID=A0ABT6KY87_9MYCO|nr:glycosyltransferase [Mycolicibacterium frederiksbergense]MDH6195682.1 UDP:flavonoid glycosyltransferase YjiC (YdhE family) [Mycolicibacterium frederiksbergense]
MKFALACYGTRGDVEPSVSVGRELQRRGNDVHLAVPPDLLGFAEAAGLETVSYGPQLREFLRDDFLRNFWTELAGNPVGTLRELWEPIARHWQDTSTTLLTLAQGADLLSTGLNYEQPAANVAEYYDIPLVALHHFPMRPNGKLVPALPSPLVRSAGTVSEWLMWRATKKAEDAQRRDLGLVKAAGPSPRRMAARGALEIQAYDDASVPGLAAEWAQWAGRRPFVGALTMELTTEATEEVATWIAAGSPPICFATGSIPLESPAETVEMISAACAELGERALICAGGTDFGDHAIAEHVKVVGTVNYAAVFAGCRAVVHHGGSGTTAASLRAGIPTLILWSTADQPYWGNQVKRLKVGTARRISGTNRRSLVTDLRRILDPQYAIRARELATRMTAPADSVSRTADLFEDAARRNRR